MTRKRLLIPAAVAALGALGGYGVAEAREAGRVTPGNDARHEMMRGSEMRDMTRMHGRMMRDAEMRQMHRDAMRDPDMRAMHRMMMGQGMDPMRDGEGR